MTQRSPPMHRACRAAKFAEAAAFEHHHRHHHDATLEVVCLSVHCVRVLPMEFGPAQALREDNAEEAGSGSTAVNEVRSARDNRSDSERAE